MKYLKIITVTMFLLLLTNCEEVIQVDLENTEPKIVIEANISNDPENNIVRITKSTDFYTPSEYETVSDAEIFVTDENGGSFPFAETEPGTYKNNNLITREGIKYSISVRVGDQTYIASSSMQKPLILDSIAAKGEKRPFRDELDYEYHVYFQDNLGIEDFARFRLFINGDLQNRIFRYDDRLTDGNYIDFDRFFFEPKEDVKPGDIITIDMLTIDKITFDYFDTLNRVTASSRGPFSSTSPSIPITNWNNDALGYFSAYSIATQSVTIE